MDVVHPRSIGKYEVLGVLGKGGMGVVYKARDPLIDRTVAIKTILAKEHGEDAQLLARLRMEAKSAGRLHHPNIVTIFDFGQQDNLTFLVMEYVEGTNLARIVDSGVELPLNTKIDIVVQLCEGLAYAHDLGVIHRDIKPANICLTSRLDPKILDFGLARFDETRLTRTGLVSGTISYMSPERLMGESGPSDDIFALGAVAYEIFTGRPAFPGANMAEVVNNIRSGAYPIPPSEVANVPTALDAVIARATAPEKSRRYATASEFAKALREVQYSETFQRRVAAEKISPSDALKTVAVKLTGENPYTAPDISAPTMAHPSRKTPSPHATVAAPQQAPAPAPKPEQPATELFSSDHFASTEMVSRDAIRTSIAPKVQSAGPPKPPEPPPAPTEQFSGVHYANTEMVAAGTVKPQELAPPAPPQKSESQTISGRRSILDVTRTVVARMRGRRPAAATADTAAEPHHTAVMTAVAQQVRHASPLRISVAAFALFIASASLGIAAASGMRPLLIAYAAALGAWFFLLRECEDVSLPVIGMIALPMHVMALFQSPLAASLLERELAIGRAMMQSGTVQAAPVPPVASLLLALWAAAGGVLTIRRVLMIVTALTAAFLVWHPQKPRRALAVATFPLLILEGTINARLEVVAMALLMGAFVALSRKRDGVTALCAVLACGIVTSSMVALPVFYDIVWQMFVFLFSAAITALLPRIILPTAGSWSASLSAMVAGSPVLTFLTTRVETLLHERGMTEWINGVLRAIAKRAEMTPRVLSEPAFAAFIVVALILIVITVLVHRAGTTEAAIADALGLMLLVCVTKDPAAWLLVLPFAIASNRRLWLLTAACSPMLLLVNEGTAGWLVYAASLILPAAWFLGLKLQDAAAESEAPAPARAH